MGKKDISSTLASKTTADENKGNQRQTNITLPVEWKEFLKEKAITISQKEGRAVDYLDLIRRAIMKTYNLPMPE